jgi:hypothetical protein
MEYFMAVLKYLKKYGDLTNEIIDVIILDWMEILEIHVWLMKKLRVCLRTQCKPRSLKFWILFLLKIIFLIFSDCFDVLISKIIFKK